MQKLIGALSRLPGIGVRSAERLALHIVRSGPAVGHELISTIEEAQTKIRACRDCGHLADSELCPICQDPSRDRKRICVVEQPTDVLSLEKSGAYDGLYHVLGGKLSPLNKVGPEQLRIAELSKRLESPEVEEVVLALPADVEGEVTATYVAQQLRSARAKVRVTRIALGLPAGGGLEFADAVTLSHAMQGRRSVEP